MDAVYACELIDRFSPLRASRTTATFWEGVNVFSWVHCTRNLSYMAVQFSQTIIVQLLLRVNCLDMYTELI